MTANGAFKDQFEKRMHERYGCEARINWSYFNDKRCFLAKMLNVGRNGVYFETDDEIEPDRTILLRLEAIIGDHRPISEKNFFQTVALADVKWCNEFSKNNSVYYGAGVRYCRIK
jgi:hypothetical protein